MADSETSAFTLPVIRGPASVRVLFHAVFSGEREGVLYVRYSTLLYSLSYS